MSIEEVQILVFNFSMNFTRGIEIPKEETKENKEIIKPVHKEETK